MKRFLIIFFQAVVALIGVGALAFMLWEPTIEGRNVNATLFQIYFNDLFLAYAYTASIAFFVALYKAFRVLSYLRQGKVFSLATAKALAVIKYCATSLVYFVVVAEAYLFIVRPGDDIAGGVFMGLLMIVVFGASASAAARFEWILKNA